MWNFVYVLFNPLLSEDWKVRTNIHIELQEINVKLTSNSHGPAACLTTSDTHNVSSQTESNQVDVVPVASTRVDEPNKEVAQMLSNAGHAICGNGVQAVGESPPVHDDDVSVDDG